ncbi:hypothetical protein CCR95_22265 [Thiocystis minor]|uniref:DNA-binding protein n=1 Tax=Thiocystis minor TaxID=61597 RepID=UPI001913C773|nr:DNA-binding protein [Thiocystis minor]MBK5966724.1 hypothetical protein [Thiocystis minor]
MARPGITQEQVNDACEALTLQGKTPTVVSVRTHLGGGSPNNVTKWLSAWKSQHAGLRQEALPPLPEAVEAAIRQVWGVAWKTAQTALEAERDALKKLREEVERERTEMLAEIARLDDALEDAQEQRRAGAEALDTERRAHEQARAHAREIQAVAEERARRLATLEQDGREAQRQTNALSACNGQREAELTRAHADLERARTLIGELRQAQGRPPAEAQRAQAELESSRNHAKEAKSIADLAGKKVQRLERTLEEERQARANAERSMNELRIEVVTLRERAAQTDELRAMVQILKQPPGVALTDRVPH